MQDTDLSGAVATIYEEPHPFTHAGSFAVISEYGKQHPTIKSRPDEDATAFRRRIELLGIGTINTAQ